MDCLSTVTVLTGQPTPPLTYPPRHKALLNPYSWGGGYVARGGGWLTSHDYPLLQGGWVLPQKIYQKVKAWIIQTPKFWGARMKSPQKDLKKTHPDPIFG